VVLAARDDGPRAALAPLLAFGARWGKAGVGVRALVCGTSQSDAGFAFEAAARRQAASLGVPVACIEDFPGNYRDVDGAPARLLIVEGEFSARLYRARPASVPQMAVIPPARYDALRGGAHAPAASAPPYRVLWAGQPETASCLATLDAMQAFLHAPDIEFLFRAHPRDAGYTSGAYRTLLASLAPRCTDVTALPLAQLWREPLRLVVTQYSSVAIEAGFLGIPSAHVLLPGAGEDLLQSQKGYRVPMPCDAGASFLVNDTRSMGVLDRALRDASARQSALERFTALYDASTPQAARLAASVAGIMG
jgi:hypothetical protein